MFQLVSFSQVFHQNPVHISSVLPYVPHVPPSSFFSIWLTTLIIFGEDNRKDKWRNWKNKSISSNPDLIKVVSRHLPVGNPPNKIASIESVTSKIQVENLAFRPPSRVVILLKVISMDRKRIVNREINNNYHVSHYYTWHYSLAYRRRDVLNKVLRLVFMSDKYRLWQDQKQLRYNIITSKTSFVF